MKTTVEIPDQLFRQAKARAAERGQSLKQLMTEALRAQLARGRGAAAAEPAWMRGFGGLRHLRGETRRVQARVDEAFETIEPEDRT